MSDFLFNEFDEVSAKQWKQKIQVDLQGADYNETLVWQSPEGLDVKPFYHRDNFDASFPPIPGQPDDWRIAQSIFIDDEVIANKLALDAIERGAEALYFTSASEFNMERLFQEFPFEKASIHFNFQFLNEDYIRKLIRFLSDGTDGNKGNNASVYYNIDILGNFARSGNWFYNFKEDHEILESIVLAYPSEAIVSTDMTLYQNAGANIVQQLAYALAHTNEYLNHFCSDKFSKSRNGNHENFKVNFKIAIGSNYFFEIAKIRALRKLYATLASEYGVVESCHIHATPSKRNKTLYDYNVNMLRTTTECMSVILGGANTISNFPYDGLYHKSNEFGERISRNQLLILKSESYFDKVINPSDGSYYIESLTQDLAEKALTLFVDIEKNGGFLKQLKNGTIQKKIIESAEKEQQLFDTGELVLVGTNKYQNNTDRRKDDLELYPFVKRNPRQTAIQPIIEKRLSEKLEQERLSHE